MPVCWFCPLHRGLRCPLVRYNTAPFIVSTRGRVWTGQDRRVRDTCSAEAAIGVITSADLLYREDAGCGTPGQTLYLLTPIR